MKVQIKFTIVLALIFAVFYTPVCAHPGSLDANGGHWDRQNGDYHYHDGTHTESTTSSSSSASYEEVYDDEYDSGHEKGYAEAEESEKDSTSKNSGVWEKYIEPALGWILLVLGLILSVLYFYL